MAEDNKPVVTLCANCQREFGLDGVIKKAMGTDLVRFSHGICERHFSTMMKELNMDDAAIKGALDGIKAKGGTIPPDLAQHPELVKQYKNDIFTPEAYRQSLKEMLQKRAGILNS
jgi:hypothetical protein